MEIAKRRPEFTVFTVDAEINSATSLTDALKVAGFEDSRFFPTLESALAMAQESPPHVVIVDYASFGNSIEGFLANLHDLSPEILTILVLPAAMKLQGLLYVSRGLVYDTISKPFPSSLELIQKVDRAIGRLYYQFESEQLREHYERGAGEKSAPAPAPPPSVISAQDYSGYHAINDTLGLFLDERDIEETVLIFMEALTRALMDVPVLYFKYFPGHMTLLFSRATLLPNETFRGIGIDLKKEEATNLPLFLEQPMEIPGMKKLIREIFKRESFAAFSHTDGQDICGVFVVLTEATINFNEGLLLTLRRSFELAYKRNLTLKEKHNIDLTDAVTGVFNKRHFSKLLSDEIARSRRLMMPVSLLVLDIDRTHLLNERFGIQQTNALLRSVANLLRKSARANDIIARVGADEFACLLPHTPLKGGAIKAERFRRLVEAAKFPLLEGLGPLTVSCGVAEYPSTSSDADMLLQTADEALYEVKASGGNKVCVARTPGGFQKDFEPLTVPSSPRPSGSYG